MTATRLTDDEVTRAAQVLGDAFEDGPLMRLALPDEADRRRLAVSQLLPGVRLAHRFGEVWWNGHGVACWMPPGHHEPTAEELAEAGAAAATAELGAEGAARVAPVFRHFAERRAALDVAGCWHLALLGVLRSARGRGHGGAVLAPRIALADAAGESCFLETLTERNVPFYETHGFDVVESGTVEASGMPYWLMLRRPL